MARRWGLTARGRFKRASRRHYSGTTNSARYDNDANAAGCTDKTYAHSYKYLSGGRLKTVAYSSGPPALHGYNDRGYFEKVNDDATGAELEVREAMDAM